MTGSQGTPRGDAWATAAKVIPLLTGAALVILQFSNLVRLQSEAIGALGLLLTPVFFGAGWLIGSAVFMLISFAAWGSRDIASQAVGRRSWLYWPLVVLAFVFLIFALG